MGVSLDAHLEQGALPLRETLALGARVARLARCRPTHPE